MKLAEFEYHMTGLIKDFFEYWRNQEGLSAQMPQEEWEEKFMTFLEDIYNDTDESGDEELS